MLPKLIFLKFGAFKSKALHAVSVTSAVDTNNKRPTRFTVDKVEVFKLPMTIPDSLFGLYAVIDCKL